MKNQSGNSKRDLHDNVGKKGKIHEDTQSQADIQLAEVKADIVPVQENLNAHAEISAKEVASDHIIENSAGSTSVDLGFQVADGSSVVADYVQLTDSSSADSGYVQLPSLTRADRIHRTEMVGRRHRPSRRI